MTDDRVTARWQVTGRVQGVGFRWFVREAAGRHGVVGDVCNRADGSVEIRVQGATGAVDGLRRDVERGPSGARVDELRSLDVEQLEDLRGFHVRG